MLQKLRIHHFALIDAVELDFENGFSVITGETGSGKSIILSAAQLILGERADLQIIASNAKKAVVEAVFKLDDSNKAFFDEHDLDFDPHTLIRREIAVEGKSRAFINDTPVSLQTLKQLTGQLLQIHSQFNTLELKSKSYQLKLLDVLLGIDQKQAQFEQKFRALENLKIELENKQAQYDRELNQQDYNTFLLNELYALELSNPKLKDLENELGRQANAAQIGEAQLLLTTLLDDNGPYDQLYARKLFLAKVKDIDSSMREFLNRIDQILIELDDISKDAALINIPELDSHEIAVLAAMQDKLNAAFVKHKVKDIEGLQRLQEQLSEQKLNLQLKNEELIAMKKHVAQLENQLWIDARQLHQNRLSGAKLIGSQLQQILKDLKLPNTTLTFDLNETERLNFYGCSHLELLFSANLGHEPIAIEKAASGGELSRLMLALQKMVSKKKSLPTIIFDEIDAGVSGDVALKMGKLLFDMAQDGQCMAISHLPQVAARAMHHFFVQKIEVQNRMQTKVEQIEGKDRVNEIARLLSGEEISKAAIENAMDLLTVK